MPPGKRRRRFFRGASGALDFSLSLRFFQLTSTIEPNRVSAIVGHIRGGAGQLSSSGFVQSLTNAPTGHCRCPIEGDGWDEGAQGTAHNPKSQALEIGRRYYATRSG
jgi:hypothetical protein